MSSIQILYVDDEQNNLNSFKATFRDRFTVHLADSSSKALDFLKKEKDIAVVLSDQRMPIETGIEFFKVIKTKFPEPIRILISAYGSMEVLAQAINDGSVYRFLEKPWDEKLLESYLLDGFKLFEQRRKNKELINALLNSNEKMEEILKEKLKIT